MGWKKKSESWKSWMILFCILIVILLGMIFSFVNSSSRKAKEDVGKELTNQLKNVAQNFSGTLYAYDLMASGVMVLGDDFTEKERTYWLKILNIVLEETSAYKVYYVDFFGEGLDETGLDIDLSEVEFFKTIQENGSGLYHFDLADEENESAFFLVTETEEGEKHFLITVYTEELLKNLLNEMEVDGFTFYLLLDKDGTVVTSDGSEYLFYMKEASNLFDFIRDFCNEEALSKAIKNRFINGYEGTFDLTTDDKEKIFIYVPLEIGDWYLLEVVNQSFFDRLVKQEWQDERTILIRLSVVLFLFLSLVAALFISDRMKVAEENRNLESMAETDMLTDLYNKIATEKKIREYMRKKGSGIGLLFIIDIDNFKKINDTMGHKFGDEVLKCLGHDIRSVFRISDIIGRTGGDEFTIFLKDISEEEFFYKEAKKLLQFFRDFKVGSYVKYSVTASIGVAVFPLDGKDFEEVYKQADTALYKAKERGKNQISFYDESIDTKWRGKSARI